MADAPFIITEPGVYDIAEADYHSDVYIDGHSLSSSGARCIINECPAIFREQQLRPSRFTAEKDLGKAAHTWLLEGDSFADRYEILPPSHTGSNNAGKLRVKSIKAAGLQPVSHADFRIIKAMHKALVEHEFAHGAFQNGLSEKSLYWRDELTGIWCRSRNDFLPQKNRIIADYKTTRCAAPAALEKDIYTYKYHQQADWYLEGVRALKLIKDPVFLFVFQEKTPPYLVTCIVCSNAALLWGKKANRKAREVFADCIESGTWPGYVSDITTLDLPNYAEYQLTDQEERGAFAVRKGEPL